MTKGILLVAFDFSTAHEDEFHDWYDLSTSRSASAFPASGCASGGSASPIRNRRWRAMIWRVWGC